MYVCMGVFIYVFIYVYFAHLEAIQTYFVRSLATVRLHYLGKVPQVRGRLSNWQFTLHKGVVYFRQNCGLHVRALQVMRTAHVDLLRFVLPN